MTLLTQCASHLLRPNQLFSPKCYEALPRVRIPIIWAVPLHSHPHHPPRTCIEQHTRENVEGLLTFRRSRCAYAGSFPHTMALSGEQGILAFGLVEMIRVGPV